VVIVIFCEVQAMRDASSMKHSVMPVSVAEVTTLVGATEAKVNTIELSRLPNCPRARNVLWTG
jgi:hypothetical protein